MGDGGQSGGPQGVGDRGRSGGPREWGTGGGSEGAGSGGSVVLMLNVVLALQVTENELALS